VAQADGDTVTIRDVEQFIYREARLQDEHAYEEWESLWTEDGVYWVPSGGDDPDPERTMSVIYDNRSRIALRVKQFLTGKRHSQTPPSRIRHLISNVEILSDNGQEVRAGANFLVTESRERGLVTWAGRSEYTLRRDGDRLTMARKKVVLVNNDRELYTLAFLI
jgi:3-phenylpropionate/cinnamic acid dioxygenase small subunit